MCLLSYLSQLLAFSICDMCLLYTCHYTVIYTCIYSAGQKNYFKSKKHYPRRTIAVRLWYLGICETHRLKFSSEKSRFHLWRNSGFSGRIFPQEFRLPASAGAPELGPDFVKNPGRIIRPPKWISSRAARGSVMLPEFLDNPGRIIWANRIIRPLNWPDYLT